MGGTRTLGVEYIIGLSVSSYAAMRAGWWPWPPTVIKTSLAFALLGVVTIASADLAAWLGAGFILANLVRIYDHKNPFVGGVPTLNTADFPYKPLALTSGAAAGSSAATKGQPAANIGNLGLSGPTAPPTTGPTVGGGLGPGGTTDAAKQATPLGLAPLPVPNKQTLYG